MSTLIHPNFKSRNIADATATLLSTEDEDLDYQLEQEQKAWDALTEQEREEHIRLARIKEIALDHLWEDGVLEYDEADPDEGWALLPDEKDADLYYLIEDTGTYPFRLSPGPEPTGVTVTFLRKPSRTDHPTG